MKSSCASPSGFVSSGYLLSARSLHSIPLETMAKLFFATLLIAVATMRVCALAPSPALRDPPHSALFAIERRSFVFLTLGSGSLLAPLISNAYERRDVGGSSRSPETAAMNEMAYQTNNRLERAGFKLDTAQEQAASLSAALSDYSYEPSSPEKGKKNSIEEKKKSGSKKKQNTKAL